MEMPHATAPKDTLMQRALLVIDVQNDYFSGPHTITYPEDSLANIQRAMDAAHTAAIPIVLVQHSAPNGATGPFQAGTWGWELAEAVRQRPHDCVIQKRLPGSFTETELEPWLRERGVDTIVIAGYMTQMCCDTTSRQAVHLGFAVEFLSDATGTHDFANVAGSITAEALHRAILITEASRFSRILSVDAWLALLASPA